MAILLLSGVYLFDGDFISIGAILLGYFIGLFVFAQILLPLLYGVPKSIYLFIHKKIRFFAIISHLITPLIWCIGLIFLGFILEIFAPSINQFLIFNAPFNIGGNLAILSLLLNFLRKEGRLDMAKDYEKTTIARYSTNDR